MEVLKIHGWRTLALTMNISKFHVGMITSKIICQQNDGITIMTSVSFVRPGYWIGIDDCAYIHIIYQVLAKIMRETNIVFTATCAINDRSHTFNTDGRIVETPSVLN